MVSVLLSPTASQARNYFILVCFSYHVEVGYLQDNLNVNAHPTANYPYDPCRMRDNTKIEDGEVKSSTREAHQQVWPHQDWRSLPPQVTHGHRQEKGFVFTGLHKGGGVVQFLVLVNLQISVVAIK